MAARVAHMTRLLVPSATLTMDRGPAPLSRPQFSYFWPLGREHPPLSLLPTPQLWTGGIGSWVRENRSPLFHRLRGSCPDRGAVERGAATCGPRQVSSPAIRQAEPD